ncbi:MAG: WXG100 family type VII secretion target [Oscillospiraceae bacterium]
MNKLLVTPSEVNEKSKEVTNLKEHMTSHLESIKTKIQNMTASNWVGTAGEAYMNQFIHVVQSVNRRTRYALQQHANNLAQAASRYSELEDAQISEATNLDSTEIFSK